MFYHLTSNSSFCLKLLSVKWTEPSWSSKLCSWCYNKGRFRVYWGSEAVIYTSGLTETPAVKRGSRGGWSQKSSRRLVRRDCNSPAARCIKKGNCRSQLRFYLQLLWTGGGAGEWDAPSSLQFDILPEKPSSSSVRRGNLLSNETKNI